MEITSSSIYWITRLDSFLATCVGFMLITIVGAFILGGVFFSMKMDGLEKTDTKYIIIKRMFFSFLFSAIFFWVGATFIPGTKEMAAIKVVPKIANSERLQNISNELCDLAVDWLKDLKKGNTHE